MVEVHRHRVGVEVGIVELVVVGSTIEEVAGIRWEEAGIGEAAFVEEVASSQQVSTKEVDQQPFLHHHHHFHPYRSLQTDYLCLSYPHSSSIPNKLQVMVCSLCFSLWQFALASRSSHLLQESSGLYFTQSIPIKPPIQPYHLIHAALIRVTLHHELLPQQSSQLLPHQCQLVHFHAWSCIDQGVESLVHVLGWTKLIDRFDATVQLVTHDRDDIEAGNHVLFVDEGFGL